MLPVSMAMGAVFLAMVDTVCRSWGSHEIPLGVVTAMVGGPVFLLLLMRSQRPS
jgi:iron complex transport system permease protein